MKLAKIYFFYGGSVGVVVICCALIGYLCCEGFARTQHLFGDALIIPAPIKNRHALHMKPLSVFSLRHYRDPFAKAIRNKRPWSMQGALSTYRLHDFSFMGFMKSRHQKWGIIRAPNGLYFRVFSGEVLGKSRGHVADITKKYLLVSVKHPKASMVRLRLSRH